MSDDLWYWPAVRIAAAIRDRELSPLEIFEAVARRIEALNPKLNAYCTLDLDRAREAARAAGEALARGDAVGPLHGVPVAIKDDIAVAGLRLTVGSRLLADYVADEDDLTVQRLKRAGAVILGKTNLPEFGHKGVTDNLVFGTTNNPWDVTRTAGGSSGGSGAAVAAGLAYLALGTDIGGSIRIPASCCGIVGLKPTLGRIPRVPVGNFFNPAWVSGPMARTVDDTALALSVLAGPDARDPYSLPALRPGELDLGDHLRGLRVAWSESPTGAPVEPAVAEAARATLARLEPLGVAVEPLGRTLHAPRRALDVLLCGDILGGFVQAGTGSRWRWWVLRALGWVNPRFRLSRTFLPFASGAFRIALRDYVGAQVAITTFVEKEVGPLFDGFDLLATPTIAVAPFPHPPSGLGPQTVNGRRIEPHLGWMFTWPFNLTAQPALSVPSGWTTDGLPLGLQLVARRGEERLLLKVAAALEGEGFWGQRRPRL